MITTTPYWPQQNGEVERQNRSILKRLTISQSYGRNWMTELNEYLLMYRSSPHSTTRKSPAEMLFGRNIRDRIPGIHQPMEIDEETVDRDKVAKEKGKVYADKRRGAKPSQIEEGDQVLIKRPVKPNKLASNFDPEVFKVVKRSGGDTIVEAEDSGRMYRRHVSHLQQVTKAAGDSSTHSTKANNDGDPVKSSSTSGPEIGPAPANTTEIRTRPIRTTKRPERFGDYVMRVDDYCFERKIEFLNL